MHKMEYDSSEKIMVDLLLHDKMIYVYLHRTVPHAHRESTSIWVDGFPENATLPFSYSLLAGRHAAKIREGVTNLVKTLHPESRRGELQPITFNIVLPNLNISQKDKSIILGAVLGIWGPTFPSVNLISASEAAALAFRWALLPEIGHGDNVVIVHTTATDTDLNLYSTTPEGGLVQAHWGISDSVGLHRVFQQFWQWLLRQPRPIDAKEGASTDPRTMPFIIMEAYYKAFVTTYTHSPGEENLELLPPLFLWRTMNADAFAADTSISAKDGQAIWMPFVTQLQNLLDRFQREVWLSSQLHFERIIFTGELAGLPFFDTVLHKWNKPKDEEHPLRIKFIACKDE